MPGSSETARVVLDTTLLRSGNAPHQSGDPTHSREHCSRASTRANADEATFVRWYAARGATRVYYLASQRRYPTLMNYCQGKRLYPPKLCCPHLRGVCTC